MSKSTKVKLILNISWRTTITTHETTFWQSTTLWFVSLDTKGFWARNCSGLCLNYLIHKSWFLFDGNRNSPCRIRKRYHLLTKCHGMSQHGWDGSMPNSISDERSDECHSVSGWLRAWSSRVEFEFMLHCHALQHTDVNDMANMLNRRDFLKILELGLKMLLDLAQIFSMSLHEDLLQPRHPGLKSKFWHYKLKDHALSVKF